MKRMLLLLLVPASLAYGRWFGDMVRERDWIPLPDGYVWDEKFAVELNPADTAFNELPPALSVAYKTLVKTLWGDVEGKTPTDALIIKVDMNGDGFPEYFIHVPVASGTGGLTYAIFSSSDGKAYHCVGSLQGMIILHPAKSGWASLEAIGRCGGMGTVRSLMRFEGNSYRCVRTEFHDFAKEKVTVRTGEPVSIPTAKAK